MAQQPDGKIIVIGQREEVPFAVEVRRGLERAAKAAGHIDLVVADNQLDGPTALRNAENLIAKGVGLVIEYQIDEKMGSVIMSKFQQAGLPAARLQGQLAGLQEVLGPIPPDRLTELESGNTRDISEAQMAGALQLFKSAHKLAVICFNDDAALGALAAARAAGREKDVVIVGQGADRQVRAEIRRPHSRIIGSTAFRPEAYGEKLVELALKLLRGEPLPPTTYIDHTFVDAETVDLVYPE